MTAIQKGKNIIAKIALIVEAVIFFLTVLNTILEKKEHKGLLS